MKEKEKFEELEKTKVVEDTPGGGIKARYNKRLLSKEASIEFFLDNCKEAVERTKDEKYPYYLPDGIEEVAEELFSMDNVHVAMTPCDDHFNKDGEWVTELPVYSYRSLDKNRIIEDVKEFVEKGAVVYIYTFFYMKDMIVNPHKFTDIYTEQYWWRLFRKKDE